MLDFWLKRGLKRFSLKKNIWLNCLLIIRIFRTNGLKVHMAFERVEYDLKYDKDSKNFFLFGLTRTNQIFGKENLFSSFWRKYGSNKNALKWESPLPFFVFIYTQLQYINKKLLKEVRMKPLSPAKPAASNFIINRISYYRFCYLQHFNFQINNPHFSI